MAFACRRSFASLALLASSSRLRAPKISRPLTASLSDARSKPSEGGRQHGPSAPKGRQPGPSAPKGRRLGPSAPRTSTPGAPPSEKQKHSESAHTADRGSAPPRQQTSSSSPPSPSSAGKRPHLEPYELSRRLIELCQRGDMDLAVTALKKAPRNAQNIKVWNTIIQRCMEARKYNLAYSVFTDLKRRGFIPNVRTYTMMMSGYATVDDWRPLTKQLEFVHSIYGMLKQHVEQTRNSVDDPADESDAPYILYSIALYISILGKAGKYQKAFDVFHELDTDGPLAASPKIYSSFLLVLADRATTDVEDSKTIEKLVSDAKYIWRRQKRSLDREPEHNMEPRSVYAMIKILSCSSQASDHKLMYDILRDTCRLPGPGEKEKGDRPPPSQTVSPTKWILQKVLEGCIAADRPDMAVYYAQSVMDSHELRPILWAGHLSKFLRAHLLLARNEGSPSPSRSEKAAEWVEWIVAQAPREQVIMPHQGTLVIALELCYRCRDMPSALRIIRAIMDSDADPEGLPLGRSGSMPIKAWERLLDLATMASPEEKRQCLELFHTHGGSVLDVWKSTSAVRGLELSEKKAHIFLALHIVKILQPAPSSPDHKGAESPDAAEPKSWPDIRSQAELFLKNNPIENPKKRVDQAPPPHKFRPFQPRTVFPRH